MHACFCKFKKITCNDFYLGVSWQQALYKAIDGSHCVVALLTQTYFESPVCTEEFNLSLAKHLTEVGTVSSIHK